MTIVIKGNSQGGVVMANVVAAAILLLTGCTTFNINAPQPNLQSINGGQSSCVIDCQTTQTATQSTGAGNVQGATVSNTHAQTEQNSPAQQATIPPVKKEE